MVTFLSSLQKYEERFLFSIFFFFGIFIFEKLVDFLEVNPTKIWGSPKTKNFMRFTLSLCFTHILQQFVEITVYVFLPVYGPSNFREYLHAWFFCIWQDFQISECQSGLWSLFSDGSKKIYWFLVLEFFLLWGWD